MDTPENNDTPQDQNLQTDENLQTETPEVLQTDNTVIIFETDEPEILQTTNTKAKRATKTAIFSPDEFELLEPVFTARFEAGITTDWNNFLRQCVDFAVNSKHVPGSKFATPELPQFFFKNGFFKP